MNSSTRLFIVTVLVADLMALVYFGGRFFLTGSVLAHNSEEHLVVEGIEEAMAAASAPKAAAPVFDLATYVPDLAKGEKVSGKCMACHTFGQGGKNKTGPNLWGIYGKQIASSEGFSYSGVLSDMDKAWNDEELQAFLEAPKKYAPGTKMQYNGVKKPAQRADLIAWLKTLK